MSIIVGIECCDSILLAADSRISDMGIGASSDVDKISVIRFGYDEVLVASAGSVPFTNRVIETARKMADGKTATKSEVTSTIEDAARITKSQLDEEQLENVRRSGAEMLIAFYYHTEPHFVFLDPFGTGIANKPEKNYCAAGVGSHLADYLIGEHLSEMPHSDLATAILIFAIKKVKDNTNLCGGQTRIKRIADASHFRRDGTGIVEQDKRVSLHQPVLLDLINLAEKKLETTDGRTKAHRNRKLNELLVKVGADLYKKQKKNAEKSLEIMRKMEEESDEIFFNDPLS